MVLELVLPTEFDLEFTDPTLVRLRGLATVANFGIPAASAMAFGAVGIIDVQGVEESIVPNVYCPLSDASVEWIWHNFWSISGLPVVDDPNTSATMYRMEIDSKAMRRLATRDAGLYLVFENSPNSDFSVHWRADVRMLFKN